MTDMADKMGKVTRLPDHTQLPDTDGTFVKNFQEHPQSILLTDSLEPVLQRLHPEGDYTIGQDCGIYWRLTDPPERGSEAPDWFYVPNIPPSLNGEFRRSYVFWQELVSPLIVLEFVSGDGSEERDRTSVFRSEQEGRAKPGKFWVYENIIRPKFYGIYEVTRPRIEVYCLENERYQLLPPNERGHYPISELEVELGLWQGEYQNVNLPWLRWWDLEGNLLLTGWEMRELEAVRLEQTEVRLEQTEVRLEQTEVRLEEERARVQQERQKAERFAAQLRSLGIEPEI